MAAQASPLPLLGASLAATWRIVTGGEVGGLKNNRTTAGLLHPFITIVWLIERGGAPR